GDSPAPSGAGEAQPARASGASSARPNEAAAPVASVAVAPAGATTQAATPAVEGTDDGGTPRTSPLVRRLAREHGIALADIQGSGLGGRVTRDDILAHLE